MAPFLHFSVQNWIHYITSHGNWPNREWYVLLLLYGQKVEHDFCSEKASHPTRLEWANVLFHCPRHTHYTDLFISRECTSATTQPTTPPSSMQSPRHNYTTQQKVTCKFNVRFWYKLLLPDRFVNKYGSLLCKRAANKSPPRSHHTHNFNMMLQSQLVHAPKDTTSIIPGPPLCTASVACCLFVPKGFVARRVHAQSPVQW